MVLRKGLQKKGQYRSYGACLGALLWLGPKQLGIWPLNIPGVTKYQSQKWSLSASAAIQGLPPCYLKQEI